MKYAVGWFAAALIILLFWQCAAFLFGDEQLLPGPRSVAHVLGNAPGEFSLKAARTGLLAVSGLLFAAVASAGLVVLVAVVPRTRLLVYPLSIAAKATPAVAFAPLLVVLFKSGPQVKIIVAAMIAFFPMLVAGLDGLLKAPDGIMTVAASYGPSRFRLLLHAQRGWVLSGFLSGLKTAAPLAVVGAIVGEFVDSSVSGQGGIGVYIASHAKLIFMDHVCAGIVVATGLGLALFAGAAVVASWYERSTHLAR